MLIVMEEEKDIKDTTVLEIARLVKEFKDNFSAKTSDTEKFLTITELENHWTELRNSTDVLYSDMIRQLITEVDERDMVKKKKESTLQKA